MIESLLESVFDLSNLTFTTFVLVFTVCILVHRVLFSARNSQNLPPCPKYKLPIVGHLHLLDPDLSKSVRRFRKELGDVFRLQLGNRVGVVVCGFDAIKEVLVKRGDDFAYRPSLPVMSKLVRGTGMIMSNGDTWKEHRRFTLTTLKDFGMGKSRLEGTIHEGIQLLFQAIDAENGRPFNPRYQIQTCVTNIICSMVLGSTYTLGDSKLKTIMDAFEGIMDHATAAGIINLIPVLGWLPGDLFKMKKMMKHSDNVFDFINASIADHKDIHEENVSDYIGAYIQQLRSLEKSGTPTTFNLHELAGNIATLFIAGSDTTATVLLWSLPLLASNTEFQTQMFEEIRTHIGTERLPSLKDKTNLAHAEAFYMEVLRYTNLAGAVLPRSVERDVDFRGYRIPADSIIFVDLGSISFEEAIWTDPQNFRPSRFIDEEGCLRKMEEFTSFSLGKRNCVGESLARMELLLFLSAIVQRYELVCPDGTDLSMDSIDGIMRMVHAPKPYEVIFRKR